MEKGSQKKSNPRKKRESRKVSINKQRFKNALKLRGVNVSELGEQINVPGETIKYCVKKENIMPDTLETICKYLDVSPEYIQGKTSAKAYSDKQIKQIIKEKSVFFSDPEEIEYFISENERRTDPDGLRIFSYSDHEELLTAKKVLAERDHGKEMIIDYLMKTYTRKSRTVPALKIISNRGQIDRSYFENHFEEIKKRIDETIISYIVLNSERK